MEITKLQFTASHIPCSQWPWCDPSWRCTPWQCTRTQVWNGMNASHSLFIKGIYWLPAAEFSEKLYDIAAASDVVATSHNCALLTHLRLTHISDQVWAQLLLKYKNWLTWAAKVSLSLDQCCVWPWGSKGRCWCPWCWTPSPSPGTSLAQRLHCHRGRGGDGWDFLHESPWLSPTQTTSTRLS